MDIPSIQLLGPHMLDTKFSDSQMSNDLSLAVLFEWILQQIELTIEITP